MKVLLGIYYELLYNLFVFRVKKFEIYKMLILLIYLNNYDIVKDVYVIYVFDVM